MKTMHWWMQEIGSLRKRCVVAQREFQHASRRAGVIDRFTEEKKFKRARKTLRVAIRTLDKSWLELCAHIERDP